VIIHVAPPAPTAPIVGTITQPSSCSAPTGSVVLTGLPATGAWNINPGGITGTGTSTTITNLAPGTYNFTIYSDPGCISHASADIVINPAPVPPTAPIVGTVTQPSSCSATTGSVVLTGLPATGTWTINPGPISGTGTSITIRNLIPGTYNFSVTAVAGCISNASADVVINAAPVAPTAPIVVTVTQPSSCATSTGSVVLNGLPATGTWTINPGSIAGTGTSTTITNLIPGTYNFNITSETGCISLPSTDVVINDAPSTLAPIVGTITQPSSCAVPTGSVVLNGLPATGTWTINPGSIAGTGATTTITNLVPGSYNFYVTSEAGCISLASASVVINAAPVAPSAPIVGTITQPSSCSAPTGSVILNGLPASGTWTINPGSIAGTGATTTLTNLSPGTYNFNVTSEPGCISVESASVVINPAPVAPTAPIIGTITQPSSCISTTGSVVLNGLPATGIWIINPGAIAGTGTSTTISNLNPGTYNFNVTSAAGCVSRASADVIIHVAPPAPTAPIAGIITQPSSCSAPTGSVVLNGLPATGTWTLNPGGITGTGTSTTITNLAPGTYNFTIYSDPGCISHASADIVINPAPVAPTAPIVGTVTQPSSCSAPTGSVVLNGLPAAGTWTINPGAISGTGTSITIRNLIPGTYNFSVTTAAGCISNASADVHINAAPPAPTAPIAGTITQPSSCGTPTGTVVLNGLPATGTWTINPGAITGTGISTTIANLIPGTYNFNITSDAGCISLPSTDIVIISPPGTPASPRIGAITQPSSCSAPTGSVVLNGLPATGTWTINPGSIAGTGTTTTITNLIPGTYNFTVTMASGCTSLASSTVVINTASGASTHITVEISDYKGFNISCNGSSNGYIRISTSNDPAQYRFDWSGPGGFKSSSKDISGLKAGQYTLSITDANNCTSVETFKLTEPLRFSMKITMSASLAGGYNINCAGESTGTLEVSPVNNVGSVTYLWSDGYWGFSRTILPSGEYKIIITDANNCTADSTTTLTEPDSLKLKIHVTKPFCPDKADGEINLSVTGGVPGNDYNYSWSDNSTGNSIMNVSEGFYKVTVSDMNRCSTSDSVQISSANSTCLVIPNAISPNRDLINDVWNITHIEQYPNVEVTIYNNWGEVVWKSERGYPRPWDGRSNGAALPIDSYFYIINLHNGSKPIGGSVTIIK
jgi:gliding motility-associated-like protein